MVFANSSKPGELTDDPQLCALLGDYDRILCLVSYSEWEDYFDLTAELKALAFLRGDWDGCCSTLGQQDLSQLPDSLLMLAYGKLY